jgi:hypothetical protein
VEFHPSSGRSLGGFPSAFYLAFLLAALYFSLSLIGDRIWGGGEMDYKMVEFLKIK